MYEAKLIAPFNNSGLLKYYKPWLIGEKAFPDIQDAYGWRGLVKKREGYSLLAALPGGDAPVQGLKNWVNPASFAESLIAFSLTKSYLYNTLTGAFVDITFLANPAGTAFSWSNGNDDFFWSTNYQSSMWITNNLPNINNTGLTDHIRFWDGTPGSLGVSGGWSVHQPTVSGTTTLDGCLLILPYKGRLVALNTFEAGNQFQTRARWSQIGTVYTSNAAAVAVTGVTAASPAVVSVASTAQFVIGQNAGFTGIVGTVGNLLNQNQFTVTGIGAGTITISADTTGLVYTSGGLAQGPGTTVPPSPFTVDIFAWRDDIPGKGGYIDADTSQNIVSAEIIKDTLIVTFQRSTWSLVYTGNEILPFIWRRINTQFGAESTYSNIAFDEGALFFSRFGWIIADTNDVARIDENIPDDSFAIEALDNTFTGLRRVQGIRDFYRQFAYWTYQSQTDTGDTANLIYAYNYLDKSWTIFQPTTGIRTFGYYRVLADITWGLLSGPDNTWLNYTGSDFTWDGFSGQNDDFPYIVGGDDAGNVFQMFEFNAAPSQDDGTSFGFNITTSQMNPYFQEGYKCRVGFVDLYFTDSPGGEITFNHYIDSYDPSESAPIISKTVPLSNRALLNISTLTIGVTTTVTTVSPHDLVTGESTIFTGVLGDVGTLLNNQELVVTVTSTTSFTVAVDTTGYTYDGPSGAIYGSEQQIGTSKYIRVFLNVTANFHQFVITLSPAQIADSVKGTAEVELQGMVIWTTRAARLKG